MDADVNPQIGQQLKDRRDELGWSLRGLEERCGVNNGLIHRIETGQVRDTSIEKLRAIADALDLSLAALLMSTDAIDVPSYRQYLNMLAPGLPDDVVQRLDAHLRRTARTAGVIIGEET